MENKNENLYNDANKQNQGVNGQPGYGQSGDKSTYGQSSDQSSKGLNNTGTVGIGNNNSDKKENWKQDKPFGQGGCEKKSQETTDIHDMPNNEQHQ